MKTFVSVLFAACMVASLSVVVFSDNQEMGVIAAVQFLLSSFALGVTRRLL